MQAISLLMALLMLFTSAVGAGPDEFPAMSAVLTTADNTVGFAMATTEDGTPTLMLVNPESGLCITADTTSLVDADGTWTIPTDQLLTSLLSPANTAIMPLLSLVSTVANSVSRDALSILPVPNGLTFSVDVDRLCHELDAVMPGLLAEYAGIIDPLLLRLTGTAVTSADLIRLWPELHLENVRTGITFRGSLLLQQDGSVVLMGSICDVSFLAKITDEALEASFTTPDGVSYQLNTEDFALVAEILSTVPSAIQDDAFYMSTGTATNADGDHLSTLTSTLNCTALERDLNAGFAAALSANHDAVDSLIDRYRSWVALTDPDLAATLSADSLIAAFNDGLIDLPDAVGTLVVTYNETLRTACIDGEFLGNTLTGHITEADGGAYTLTLTCFDAPIVLTLAGAPDGDDAFRCTLTSSTPFFGLFNAVSFACNSKSLAESYYAYDLHDWALTTDTNVFRLTWSDTEQLAEVKLGPVTGSIHADENGTGHIAFNAPDFFLSAHSAYGGFNLDSTFLGFDWSEHYDGFTLSGYIPVEGAVYYERTTFGLDFHSSSGLYGWLNGADLDCSFSFSPQSMLLTVTHGGDVYAFLPDYAREMYVVTCNADVLCSVSVEEDGKVNRICIYDGMDTEVDPLLTLQLENDPEGLVIPVGGTPVDATTFLEKFGSFLENLY